MKMLPRFLLILAFALLGVAPALASTTYTPCWALPNPQPGDPATANIWGTIENTGRTLVDNGTGQTLSLSVAGGSNVVLTAASGAADQARNAHFILTGTLTGNINVLWPQTPRCGTFSVFNNTTGAFTLSAGANNGSGSPAGATVTIPQGGTLELVSDGTNVSSRVTISGLGGMLGSNNLSDLTNFTTARANLGVPTGTSGHVLGFLDGANTFSANQTVSFSNPASNALVTSTNTSSTGVAQLYAQNDTVGRLVQIGAYGTTASGTNFGSTAANSGFMEANNLSILNIGTNNLAPVVLGVNGTGALVIQTDLGIYTSGTGGSQGAGTINAANFYKNGTLLTGASTMALPVSIANGGTGQTTAGAALSALGGIAGTANGIAQQGIFWTATGGTYSQINAFGGVSISRSGVGQYTVTLGSTGLNLGGFTASCMIGTGTTALPDFAGATLSASNAYSFNVRGVSSNSLADPDRCTMLFY